MPWLTRGLRDGIVTSRYPRRRDGYGQEFRGAVSVLSQPGRVEPKAGLVELCPTGAITAADDEVSGPRVSVDRGRCILCGRCVAARPDVFAFDPSAETAALRREALIVPMAEDDDIAGLRHALDAKVRGLRRSVHIRHIDAGSDGSEEWEVAALTNPVYDIQRLGIFFTASPRHADLLLATGVGTIGMMEPLRLTWEAMPGPKIVLAAGTDAVSGGLVRPTYATSEEVLGSVPVDVWIPGSPPSPFSLLYGILLAIGRLPAARIPS